MAKTTARSASPAKEAGQTAGRDLATSQPAFEMATILVDQIDLQPDRSRRATYGQDMDDLGESICAFGVTQPILVVRLANGRYEVRSGERRLNACKQVGLTRIPAAVVMSADDALFGLIDNFLHERLPALDEALWLAQIKAKDGFTDERLAAMLGRSRTGVTQMLGVANLPESILDVVRALPNQPSRDSLIQLAQCADAEQQQLVLEKIKAGATQAEIRRARKGAATDEQDSVDDANVIAVRRAIGRALKHWHEPGAMPASWKPNKDEVAEIKRFIRLLRDLIKKDDGAATLAAAATTVAAPVQEASGASVH